MLRIQRLAFVVCGVVFSSVPMSPAYAQVTMHLTYTEDQTTSTCVFKTDTNGISAATSTNGSVNTGDILATADAITGGFISGCPTGVQTPATPAFNINLAASTTSATVGVPFTLSWRADADSCRTEGSVLAESFTAWPSVNAICSSAVGCGSTGTISAVLTPSVVGQNTFGLNCYKTANATPVSSQQVTVNVAAAAGTPSFTQNLAAAPSSVTAGSSTTLSWRADADYCTTQNSTLLEAFAGWPNNTTHICDSATACGSASTISVALTPATVGTDTFKLNCYKTNNPTPVSQQVAVTVSEVVPGNCSGVAPSGLTRQTVGDVVFYSTKKTGIDLTTFQSIWGRESPTDTDLTVWPGVSGALSAPYIKKNQYLAAQFTVPTGSTPGKIGDYPTYTTYTHADYSMSISECPGDFRKSVLSPYCYVDNTVAESYSVVWGIGSIQYTCPLTIGNTYYLNIMSADMDTPTVTNCTASSGQCAVQVKNAQ